MEYQIAYANRWDRLTEEVNNLIKRGWRPIGGISVAVNGTTYNEYWAQAMTKEKTANGEGTGDE